MDTFGFIWILLQQFCSSNISAAFFLRHKKTERDGEREREKEREKREREGEAGREREREVRDETTTIFTITTVITINNKSVGTFVAVGIVLFGTRRESVARTHHARLVTW